MDKLSIALNDTAIGGKIGGQLLITCVMLTTCV